MIRISLMFVLLLIGHAYAETIPAGALDTDRMIAVYTEALTFATPRIVDPVPMSQLTVWGLQSLTALDQAMRVGLTDSRLQLTRGNRTILEAPLPRNADPAQWAKLAVSVTAAGFPLSQPMRRAGTQGLMQAFFEQMFIRLDPYSRYVPPVEAGEDRARRAGQASLGMEVQSRGVWIEVRSVVRDSPAAIAGIHPGDILVSVDGQQTKDQDTDTIEALLSGDEGSIVTVSWRGRDGRSRELRLAREMVPPETVFAQRIADVLLVKITGFSASTALHLAQSVQDAMAEPHPVSGIILDMRDNRGGLLRQAVTAADTFLSSGLVATTIGRDPEAMNIWRSTEGELAENVPLIILVDGRSASAAEIMAAALADRGRAVVVGSETVGKGMVQTIDPMPDGGELFVTWSQTLAPLGWPIQGLGLLPQVCTSLGRDALNRQLAALSTGFQPMAESIKRARAARLPMSASEVLEIRAACPAAEARAADIDAARLLISNPAAYAAALLPPMRAAH